MQEFLVTEQVKWKFNLSRVTWWGGQFERMVGLVKQCLYKATGNAKSQTKSLRSHTGHRDKLKQSTADVYR